MLAKDIKKAEVDQLNYFDMFATYQPTWVFHRMVRCEQEIIAMFTGNQLGKTSLCAFQYVLRILGLHPVVKKNVLYFECDNNHVVSFPNLPKDKKCKECGLDFKEHKRRSRVFRFAAENLPGQSKNLNDFGISAEVRNTQYPEFKKWLPPVLIKSDISTRSSSMIIQCPFGGDDIVIDFVSYSQRVAAGAGVQRLSVWCVAEGQRVLHSNGIWENIENVTPGSELICETLGGHDKRQRVNKVKSMISNGSKEVLKINCQKGLTFEVTKDHLVMVPALGKSEYKKAGDLKVGDSVTCKLPVLEGHDTLEKWQIVLLAVMLGDGSMTGKVPKFTCGNQVLANSIEGFLPEYLSFRKQEFKNDHVPDYFIISTTDRTNELKDFLTSVDVWGKKSGNKFIPDIIFTQSKETIALFLSYLFACDGWASGHSIGYCSTSHKLTQDVFLLLRNIGIRSTIIKREFTNNWNDQWWVNISTSRDVLKFIDEVGIIAKQGMVDSVRNEAFRRRDGSESVPKNRVIIKSIENIGVKNVYDITMETGGWDDRLKNGVRQQRKVARSPRNNFLIQGGVVVHNCDEEPPYDFYMEQLPRLMAENGDLLISLTPANHITWTYDTIFERAEVYYRTQAICDFLETKDYRPEKVEETGEKSGIAVLQASTYDNPTLEKKVIEGILGKIDDEDEKAIRVYGIFKQVSGRVFKDFNPKVHVIRNEEYFPNGVNADWTSFRACDYHPQTPWAIVYMSLSDRDELFIWKNYLPSPEKLTTLQICNNMADLDATRYFRLSLIDPLSETIKKDTISVRDDVNRIFRELKKNGRCTGGHWYTWNTKGEVGRDEIRKRLKNSSMVGRPFNNKVLKNGATRYLPTVWILDECRDVIQAMKQWRWEDWSSSKLKQTKDDKNKPEQRWSHTNMAIEAICKHPLFKSGNRIQYAPRKRKPRFQRAR